MPVKKDRLYIALYPSGVVNNEERKYVKPQIFRSGIFTLNRFHWGFLIGPKKEKGENTPGTRYHVKNAALQGWMYEEVPLQNVKSTNNLLARIMIAKIDDKERLVNIFRTIPVIQLDPNWRCRTWVANALEAIEKDGKCVGTSQLDWSVVEAKAREYVAQKTAAGRYDDYADILGPKPTWDMLDDKEIVS